MPSKLKIISIAALLFAADQATKYFAYRTNFGSFLNWLRPVVGKLIFPNYNFAFSLSFPHYLFYIIYFLLLAALSVWFFSKSVKNAAMVYGYTFIMTGALANIFDRIALGYVRDFIYIFWGNIFNLADIYILLGILLLLFE